MLDRQGLQDIADRMLDDFIAHPPESPRDCILRATSGTTAASPLLIVQEQRSTFVSLESFFWGAKRVLICFGAMSTRYNYASAQYKDAPGEKGVLVLDGSELVPALCAIIGDFMPDRIIGSPSFIARAADFFSDEAAQGVQAIKCAGEAVTEQLRSRIAAKFPNAALSVKYATSELSSISRASCGHLPLNCFHPRDGVHIDIMDPDETGLGDVAVTTTGYAGTPIEQYQTGDMGRLMAKPCECAEAVTLELVGRKGFDYLKLCGALLVQAEFERVVRLFPHAIHDYRVEATADASPGALLGAITLHAYCTGRLPSGKLQKEIAGRFSDELFLTAGQTLADLVRAGAFLPLKIVWRDEPFPGGPKAVRLRLV